LNTYYRKRKRESEVITYLILKLSKDREYAEKESRSQRLPTPCLAVINFSNIT